MRSCGSEPHLVAKYICDFQRWKIEGVAGIRVPPFTKRRLGHADAHALRSGRVDETVEQFAHDGKFDHVEMPDPINSAASS